jgi:hypothetical protein
MFPKIRNRAKMGVAESENAIACLRAMLGTCLQPGLRNAAPLASGRNAVTSL